MTDFTLEGSQRRPCRFIVPETRAGAAIKLMKPGGKAAVRRIAALTIAGLGLAPAAALAHHSVSAWFNEDEVVELEGVITEVRWQNPHVRFFMRAPDGDGAETVWEIETYSVSGISRWGITENLLEAGQRVRVAGNPSRRGRDNVFVRNVLLPTGEELVLGGGSEPRWSDDVLRGGSNVRASEGEGSRPDLGIFRVWSTGAATSMLFPENIDRTYDLRRYPLTPAAEAAVDAFDLFEDDPTRGCVPKGMPLVMEQPYPMQFVDEDEQILLRLEEYDTVRTIHMDAEAAGAEVASSKLGHSVGRWDGPDLVVTTTRINSGSFDSVGIPLSERAVIVERFAPTEDGARLDYTMTVTDPVNFTEPVELNKHWIWRPEVTLERFDCSAANSP